MDHDTYSANDAIGRVNIDCNIFMERMRMAKTEVLDETFSFKVYDTIYGNRGELTISVKMHLLMQYNPKNYVHIISSEFIFDTELYPYLFPEKFFSLYQKNGKKIFFPKKNVENKEDLEEQIDTFFVLF